MRLVLALNLGMFFVEVGSGLVARSTALLGDSLDMLGDALVYGVTLWVLGRGPAWSHRASLLKGLVMTACGLAVLVEAVTKAFTTTVPRAEIIGIVALLALATNVSCWLLLAHHRDDDTNMRSAWICSRNDIVANLAVLVAALGVHAFDSWIPDVVAGVGIAGLFLVSATRIVRDALKTIQGGGGSEGPLEGRSSA